MGERARPAPANDVAEKGALEEQSATSPRAEWPVEDDELLLLDEIDDETPDDNIADLV